MLKNTKEFGNLAENIAGRYLEKNGYRIIERNYRKPWGEIDIVVFKDKTVVFVEVKANSRQFYGGFDPEVRVDQRKLDKIVKTAKLYLENVENREKYGWQVDIVSVTLVNGEETAKIKHIKNVAEDYI